MKQTRMDYGVVLSVSPIEEDHTALERILRSPWQLSTTETLSSALTHIALREFAVIICEQKLVSGSWKDVLNHVRSVPHPPLVVVTSRLADERLWAEALNLGAYDVLAKPFDATEVRRVVGLAGARWQSDRLGPVHRQRSQIGKTLRVRTAVN